MESNLQLNIANNNRLNGLVTLDSGFGACDVISRLSTIQGSAPKDSANPNKNIIHNLCTSAGNLLGYRSPGTYDGSGIVYGNASRLCDAILAFLYAVFSDVHDNQPYVAGRSVLHDDVIVQLKSQLWRGHKGFCQVMPKVANGLQRYNAAVKASNEKVKEPIETVLEYVKSDGELRKGITDLQITETSTSTQDERTVESAVSLVERCKEVAKVFSKSLTAATSAINDLNPKLKRKLENARRSFFNHVDWLSRWSKKGEKRRLDQMVQKIKSRLKRLANSVKDKIKQEVHTVVELLKDRVREIKMNLEGITASLEEYVKELGQWMGEAKKYIKDVKKHVDDIMKQLDGDNKKKIDKAAADIDSELGKKVEELNEWIDQAEGAVTVAKKKAEDVFKRLDKDNSTKIRQGFEKITKAKDAVTQVSSHLVTVNSDLGDWKGVAQGVLRTAVERAEQVHKQLDPAKNKSTLGGQINAIDTANNDIMSANEQLGEQVKSLNKWIQDAEDIRAAAETKAKEAYDKLKVHDKLSENVKKILDAKEKIDEVHGKLKGVDSQLVTWSDQAEKVLEGAIKNAEYVHERLKDGEVVDRKIKEIGTNNASIVKANKDLESEVQHLGNWKDAARKVIEMADKKCDEILKKVDKDHEDNEGGIKGPVIYKQAKELQDRGTKLLIAASEAKQEVEKNVAEALEAVKEMDDDLKRDLFEVKKKIKEGISKVIAHLQVDQLGEKVKEDLVKLRENIEKIAEGDRVNGLISKELDALNKAKTPLTEKTGHIKTETLKEMDTKFKESIKDPLNEEVKDVEAAIAKLYDKIDSKNGGVAQEDKKKIHKIFEYMKKEVEKIKGVAGKGVNDSNSKGIDGIVTNVKVLAETYHGGNTFQNKVNGFVIEILKHNKIVREMLEKYAKDSSLKEDYIKLQPGKDNSLFNTDIALLFQQKLQSEAHAAGKKVEAKFREADNSEEKIQGYIDAVKEGLTTFVDEVEEKLKLTDIENLEEKIDEPVDKIVSQIEGAVNKRRNTRQTQTNDDLIKLAVKRIFMKLIVIVRKDAGEVQFLGAKVFGKILDTIKPTVDDLNTKLTNAAKTGNPATGTAKAVDEAIKEVRTEVGGLGGKFEEVKKPVEDAVQSLDKAVTKYDKSAKEQVTEAAKTAIDKAANEISTDGDESKIDLGSKMENFNETYQDITSNLQPRLTGLLNEHIGRDGKAGGGDTVSLKHTLSFGAYRKHIKQNGVDDGRLKQAIERIRDGVDDDLKMIEPRGYPSVKETVEEMTFNSAFALIARELLGITNLINETNSFVDGGEQGVKALLTELHKGVGKNKLADTEKGLDAITEAIRDLQEGAFSTTPKAIEEIVTVIKAQIADLRTKLQGDNDSKKDVLNALKDLKDVGLASVTWNGTVGLAHVHKDLEEQNNKLAKQNRTIGEAFDYTVRELKGMLGQVGLRLHNIVVPDDVMDNLRKLKVKMGKGQKIGLERIHESINTLQEGYFKSIPEAIENAKVAFEAELKRLRSGLQGDTNNGVIETLKDLMKAGLGSDDWVKGENKKGLQKIEKELMVQQESLAQQPAKINLGVTMITNMLDELGKELNNEKGNPNNGVISALNNLQVNGLGQDRQWNGKDGLGKIKNDLHDKNRQLYQTSKIIEEATQSLMEQTDKVLRSAKQKLSDDVANDDIVDNLKELEGKIGLSKNTSSDSLKRIYKTISGLRNAEFENNPTQIGQAKHIIDSELKKLQGELQSDVTGRLKDFMTHGFGLRDRWNNNDAKGFDHIKSNLQGQQSVLSNQPEQIASGMTDITDELQSVRTVLQGTGDGNPQGRGVIKNLNFLTTQLGENENKGLKLISRQTESLQNSQVPLITKHLNAMSLSITNAAAQLGLNLNQLEDPHIDGKLRDIQSGLNKLRLTDLAAAIKLCDDFLIKADEIERNTIDALWKHVDNEVDDAIGDLTKEARGLYVDSVKDALELFARKVNEDLEQLPGDINHDLKIGFKGFMNAVEGENSGNINKLKCVESRELKHLSAAFASFFGAVNEYVRKEIARLHDEQNKEKNLSLPPTDEPYTPKLNDVYEALTALLAYFRDNDGDADRLTELVERLTKALGNLVPTDFKHQSTPLLDTVSRGLSKFAGEFHNTYISAYSGQRCKEEYAHKYAKVLLSMIPMTHQALSKLATKCEREWKDFHITEFTADDRDNALGNYLTRCGYRVSSYESVQDGELNNMFAGAGIYELLTTPTESVDIEMTVGGEQIKNQINLVTVVAFLYNVLCHYFQACHIYVPPKPRYPCTVRDMLSWLSGLQYTRVAEKLLAHCKTLLNRKCHVGDTPNKEDPVMAKCIGELPYTIASTCSRSTALLTAIQGNGHGFDLAAYPYSVDFSNNRAKLHYPNDPAELLDMLREIACRLCRVLYFLYSQCCRSTARVKGWRECAYGRQVQSHHWQCDTLDRGSTNSATTTTAATTTSSTPTHGCPPTSPLQSFLSDSCHGLLPHTLTAADMKIECANCTANQPGQQCLTPLGFWDLGFAASICGTGWDLAKRLGDMCRDGDSCLFVLCRTLHLLCPTAPSSLADVFALYAQVLRQWDPHERVNHRGGTYTDASGFISHLNTDGIDSLFPLWTMLHGSYENGKLTTAIASLAGHDHKSHDALSSLFNDTTCKSTSGCAPYLQPLGLHAHHTYPKKHAGLYITWIIYLAWQFWELLSDLLQAVDNIDCTASGCATCPCQPGTHGGKDICHCPSIVQCAGLLPTLYRYGFTYRNANLLVTANRAIRCGDLNTQLRQALHSAHFTELFRQIDQLMWHIRMPFLYCFSALWSFVALYILHTFLYRLDIFHIRSHLIRTKTSHLIDVKAVLSDNKKMLSLYDANYFNDDPAELLNLI